MATGWRLAKSLEVLRNQVNSAYPNRSKASDGTIGDASHAASASDHNPNKNGVVCALDLTNDPANGFDVHALAEHLRLNRHPNLRYIISNARVAGWWTNWEWQPSSGHTQHAHFSVGTLGVGDGKTYDRYDDETKWSLLKENNMQEQDIANIIGEVWGIPANANNLRDYKDMDPLKFMYHILGVTTPWQDRKNNFILISQQNTSLKQQIKDMEQSKPGGDFTKAGELFGETFYKKK